jgi:hypothetical protein
MRRAQFKVWDKKYKMMAGPADWYMITQAGALYESGPMSPPRIVANEDDYEILWYTGLKDKHGKEIYEGDIVRYRNIYREGHPYLVNVVEDMFDAAFYHRSWTSESAPEIIGNIYENPELLEKEAK